LCFILQPAIFAVAYGATVLHTKVLLILML